MTLPVEKRRIVRLDSMDGQCWRCEAPIPDPPPATEVWHVWETKTAINVNIRALCAGCGAMAVAVAEARDECRRFTELAYDRCKCGRTYPMRDWMRNPWCITCRRNWRMLGAARAVIRLNRDLLRQSRRALKETA